jgi:O-antigen/teichoic acid export membrane protein
LFVLLGRVFQAGAYFIVIILIARYLSIEEFGNYSFINAFVSTVMVFSFFGVGRLLTREISRNKGLAAKYVGVALVIRFGLVIILAAIVQFLSVYAHLPMPMFLAVQLAIALNVFQAYTQLLFHLFRAFERMIYEPVVYFFSGVTMLLGVLAVILLDLGFLAIFMAMAFAGLIMAGLVTIILLKDFGVPRFDFTKREIFRFIKGSAIVGIGMYLYMCLFKVDVLLLKWLSGIEDVAYFQGVHHIILRIDMLPAAIMAAIFPRISRFAVIDTENLKALYQRTFNYIFIVGLSVSILLFCFSEEIILILLGHRFLPSVNSLKVLSFSVIALFLNIVMNDMLVGIGKERITIFIGILALMLNVLVAIILIPRHGQLGAAMAASLSYTMLFVTSFIYLFMSGYRLSLHNLVFKPLLAGAAATAVTEATKGLGPLASFLMGGSLYGLLLWKLKVLNKGEMKDVLGRIMSSTFFAK